jgi:hypothetical protein
MSTQKIKLSQACEGMIRYKQAAGKSDATIYDYRVTFKKLALYFKEDPPFADITRGQMIEFFVWLQHEYVSVPDGVTVPDLPGCFTAGETTDEAYRK